MAGRKEAVYVPDGGWGWVIVTCSFLIHMLVVGTLYALSVLYVSWLEAFNSGKGITSWIISMAVAVMFGIGPLPGSLSRRFGNRPVVMMGGIMMATGFFISSFAMNVYFLIVSVGLLIGVGAGCCYLPSVSLVAQYFTSKRSLAMGISASGLGVGAFFMAPFLNWLVNYFGWRGTMQILSGISLNMCVLASLMRPLELAPHCRNCQWIEESEWASEQLDVLGDSVDEGIRIGNTNDEETSFLEGSHGPAGTKRDNQRSFLCNCGRPNQSVIRMLDTKSRLVPINYFPSPALVNYSYTVRKQSRHTGNRILHPELLKGDEEGMRPIKAHSAIEMNLKSAAAAKAGQCNCTTVPDSDKEMALGGSLTSLEPGSFNLPHRSYTFSHIPSPFVFEVKESSDDDCPPKQGVTVSLAPARSCDGRLYDSVASFGAAQTADEEAGDNSLQCRQESVGVDRSNSGSPTLFEGNLKFCCSLKKIKSAEIYIKLMHSCVFMVFCISNFLTNLSFLMPVLYMVDRALDAGIGKNEAAILVSVYGAGNIFGKVFFGWLADRKFLDRLLYYIGCLSMCGAATCVSPLCGSSLTLHGVYAFGFGCFIGAYCTLFPLVTVDLVGMSVVEESFGMLLCFMGTATAIGTPLAGWIFDFTGSYTWAFFLHGAFILISALMLIPVAVKKKRRSK